jgi:hypothetical protein
LILLGPGCNCRIRIGSGAFWLVSQLFEAEGGGVEDSLGVQRRDEPGAEILQGLEKQGGERGGVHVGNGFDEHEGVGGSLLGAVFPVRRAVGRAPEGEAGAGFAGGQGLGAELGHDFLSDSGHEKRPACADLVYCSYFIKSTDNSVPGFLAGMRFGFNGLRAAGLDRFG